MNIIMSDLLEYIEKEMYRSITEKDIKNIDMYFDSFLFITLNDVIGHSNECVINVNDYQLWTLSKKRDTVINSL